MVDVGNHRIDLWKVGEAMAGWTVADRGRIYGEAYEARQRDPVVDIVNRASVPNGRMNRWQRFNKGELLWMDTPEGMRATTRTQNRVWELLESLIASETNGPKDMPTVREVASVLNVSPSTVSRAITKFVSWGLLRVIVARGRYGGIIVFRAIKDDGFEALRRAAKERIRRWYQASQRRLSRLALNVAPYINEEGRRVLVDPLSTTSSKGATLTAQRTWTPDELRSVGII